MFFEKLILMMIGRALDPVYLISIFLGVRNYKNITLVCVYGGVVGILLDLLARYLNQGYMPYDPMFTVATIFDGILYALISCYIKRGIEKNKKEK